MPAGLSNGPLLVRLIKSLTASAGGSRPHHHIRRAAETIHSYVLKAGFSANEHVCTALLSFYAAGGGGAYALKVFDEIPHPGVISWTSMARACITLSRPQDALRVYKAMVSSSSGGLVPDAVAITTALHACRLSGNLFCARILHCFIITSGIQIDEFMSTELITAYGDHGQLVIARHMFDRLASRTLAAWNTMVNQYTKHESIDVALSLFNEMPIRDSVSWNTMISGYSHLGRCREALSLFIQMNKSSVEPNKLTMRIVLSVCARLGALDTGMWVQAYIDRNMMNSNGCLDHCLIDMYAKCGGLEKALQVFDKVQGRADLYAWTSIICALAMHGQAEQSLQFFSRMQSASVKPDSITFVGVLNACAHGGLVHEGCHQFHQMQEKHRLLPEIEHYSCMVDLFGRVGWLREAYDLILGMPMYPNAVVWGTLLSACKVYNHVALGEIAAAKLFQLDPCDQWARVMLSNIYADTCNWVGVMRLRKEMNKAMTKKAPGCSSTEVDGEVHEFLACGNLHPELPEIHVMLQMVEAQMQWYSQNSCHVTNCGGTHAMEKAMNQMMLE